MFILVIIFLYGLFFWVNVSNAKPPQKTASGIVFQHSIAFKTSMILIFCLSMTIPTRMLVEFDSIKQPYIDKVAILVFIFLVFLLITIPLLIEAFRVKHVLIENNLISQSFWRAKPICIDCKNITSVTYSPVIKAYSIITINNQKVRISTYLQGVSHLLDHIEKHTNLKIM